MCGLFEVTNVADVQEIEDAVAMHDAATLMPAPLQNRNEFCQRVNLGVRHATHPCASGRCPRLKLGAWAPSHDWSHRPAP